MSTGVASSEKVIDPIPPLPELPVPYSIDEKVTPLWNAIRRREHPCLVGKRIPEFPQDDIAGRPSHRVMPMHHDICQMQCEDDAAKY